MNGQGESKNDARRLKAIERQRQALELRKAGVSFHDIARQLEYSGPSSAYKAVTSALRKTLREPAEAVRTLHRERYNQLLLKNWTRALAGDDRAVAIVLDIMDKLARLDGLNAPLRVRHGGDQEAPPLITEIVIERPAPEQPRN